MHQRLYPVILCGGAGARLWPASRPDRPKPFLRLTGGRSLFQDAVERVATLAGGGGELMIVAGVEHRFWVETQLAEIGRVATIILEPEGRDSAPAMAAAATYIMTHDPEGVAVFVASDHHLPDAGRFREAVLAASAQARRGHVVTLGVRPTGPSTAHGYILPVRPGLSPVQRFVEKPDQLTAALCMAEGYLWNSGIFIVGAATLLMELDRLAPEVTRATRAALAPKAGAVIALSSDFSRAPSISIDHAVMEHTHRAWVLPVDFDWSDLGTWSAVAALSGGGAGAWIGAAGDLCLVRAAEGMVVATAGVSNLVVIAERDAVLVCDLDRTQEVKGLVARIRAEHPAHEGAARKATPPESLADAASRFAAWMRISALPLWATLGVDGDGQFINGLTQDGRAVGGPAGLGVQAGQVWVYGAAGRLGWRGPWRRTVDPAIRGLLETAIDTAPPEDKALDLYRAGCENTAMTGVGPLAARLKAVLILAEDAQGGERARLMSDVRETLQALQAQLSPNGLWHEPAAVDGAASAASLRLIMSAYVQLAASAGTIPELAGCDLSLG